MTGEKVSKYCQDEEAVNPLHFSVGTHSHLLLAFEVNDDVDEDGGDDDDSKSDDRLIEWFSRPGFQLQPASGFQELSTVHCEHRPQQAFDFLSFLFDKNLVDQK